MMAASFVCVGQVMFVLRSLFWLGTLVMLLPPAQSGRPAPRLDLIHAAYAAKVLVQDVTGVCGRNPAACSTSRQALAVLTLKLKTGAGIVSAGIAASQAPPLGGAEDGADHGTLTGDDLRPAWSAADAGSS